MARLDAQFSLSASPARGPLAAASLVMFLTVGVLAGATPRMVGAATPPIDHVTLAMGYIPNVQFAPFYMAKARGYYSAAHLDVTFKYGIITDLLRQVGAGTYAFANGDSDGVIAARASGIPVRYVAAQYQRFPIVVFSLAESHITRPADLRGKTIGVPGPYGSNYIGLLALLQSAGLGVKDVHVTSIGYTQVQSVASKKVQAAVGFAMNEPVQLRQQGYHVNVLPVGGVAGVMGPGLVSNDTLIAKNPDLVRRFVRASLAGLRATLRDPKGAFSIARTQLPTKLDAAQARYQYAVLTAALPYWHKAGQRLGYTSLASWASLQKIMHAEGQLAQTVPPTTFFTNSFLP